MEGLEIITHVEADFLWVVANRKAHDEEVRGEVGGRRRAAGRLRVK